jgi:deoxyadenosine/deoxycytidine kinase
MYPKIYCIDGNIGAGKSAVLDELSSRGYFVYKEELESWGWCLANYYSDFDRWAFTLQMAILQSMANQHINIKATNAPVVFIERSPASGMVFTRNSFRRGFLSANEMSLVESFYNLFGWAPHTTFKIDTLVEKCFERIVNRARECERDLTIDYLRVLEEEYNSTKYTSVAKTITIDSGTRSPSQIADEILATISSH